MSDSEHRGITAMNLVFFPIEWVLETDIMIKTRLLILGRETYHAVKSIVAGINLTVERLECV